MKRLISVVTWIGLGLALLAPVAAQAQAWPARAVRIVAPFPPGSALDLLARMVAPRMQEAYGQPVVVENRVGANGMIGSEMVAHSPPDGYTIQIGTSGTHVTSIFLNKNVPYDPVKDFTPITAAVEPATCVVVNPSLAVHSIRELIDYAKRYPGLPEVPTVTETLSGFQKPATWFGFLGPAGLPQPILARLNGEIVKAISASGARAKLEAMGLNVIGNTPEQFSALIRSGIEQYGRIVKSAGIQPE